MHFPHTCHANNALQNILFMGYIDLMSSAMRRGETEG